MKYDYKKHITNDVKSYIKDNYHLTNLYHDLGDDKNLLISTLFDKLVNEDSVTGNGSGSRTFNRYEAERDLLGNWGLMLEAKNSEAPFVDILEEGPEYADCLIRTYVLEPAIRDAVRDLLK